MGSFGAALILVFFSLIPFFVTPEWFFQGSTVFKNQKKKQKRGFPIKDFGNDKKGRSSLLNNASIIPLSVIPEWFYEGSKLFKGKKRGFPPPRHPGNL